MLIIHTVFAAVVVSEPHRTYASRVTETKGHLVGLDKVVSE